MNAEKKINNTLVDLKIETKVFFLRKQRRKVVMQNF